MTYEMKAAILYTDVMAKEIATFDHDIKNCEIFYIPKFPTLSHRYVYNIDVIMIYFIDNDNEYSQDIVYANNSYVYAIPYNEYIMVPECELRSWMSNIWTQIIFQYIPYYRIDSELFDRILKLKAFT